MLNFKGMCFPIDVILVCICWYVAYPLSYRHLEEMMEERGVSVDHSSINRWLAHHLFDTLDEIQDFATRWHGLTITTGPTKHLAVR